MRRAGDFCLQNNLQQQQYNVLCCLVYSASSTRQFVQAGVKREEECAREDFYTGMMTKWNAASGAASVVLSVCVCAYIYSPFLFMVNRSRVFVSAAEGARARAPVT